MILVWLQNIINYLFFSQTKYVVPFEIIHVDLWGPYQISTFNDDHNFFTIVDDYSRSTWIYLLHTKDQVVNILSEFFSCIGNHYKAKPKFLRSENGTK